MNYKEIGVIDISKKRTLIFVSLLGLVLMAGFCALFYWLLYLMRPVQFNSDAMNYLFGSKSVLVEKVGLLVLIALMLVLHEALHGVCFWVFTGSRPRLPLKDITLTPAFRDGIYPKYLIWFLHSCLSSLSQLQGLFC
jgi:hypothetical protein